MSSEKKNLRTAYFVDLERENVCTLWVQPDGTDYEEVIPADENMVQFQELLKHVTVDKIHKNTDEKRSLERQAFLGMVKQIAADEGLIYSADKAPTTTITIQSIIDLANKKEEFFEFKLNLFEHEKIKESTDREWKAAMRKSTDMLELISMFHAGPKQAAATPTSVDEPVPEPAPAPESEEPESQG